MILTAKHVFEYLLLVVAVSCCVDVVVYKE